MSNKICFYVAPIGDEGSDIRKNSDTVLNHLIRPICESLDFKVIRVDELNSVDNINQTIIDQLTTADLVIADMTGHNPNVFYEFGYRQAKGLPLIPIITEGETIPFDVSTLRTIQYVTNDLDKAETVKKRLTETIKSFSFNELEIPNTPVSEKQFDNTIFLNMQDKLDEIIYLVKERNNTDIDTITSQVVKHASPQVSDSTAMIQTLMPELLKNPEAFKALVEMSGQFRQK